MDAYLTGMHFAYGLKKVLGAYTGPLLRVRRDSDNTEQDIGFVLSSGLLNTTELAIFVGSASAYVTKWYDQTLTVDAIQTTTTQQPKIVNAGTYLGLLQFDGIDDQLITHTPAVQALSFAALVKLGAVPAGVSSYFAHPLTGTSGNNGLTVQVQNNDGQVHSYVFTDAGNYSSEAAGFSPTITSIVVVLDRASYPPTFYADGAYDGTGSSTVGTPTNANYSDQDLNIGSFNGSTQPGSFQYKEFIGWTANQNANYFGIFGAL